MFRELISQNREKLLEGHKKYWMSDNPKLSFKDKKHTDDTKQLMSLSKKEDDVVPIIANIILVGCIMSKPIKIRKLR